MFAQRSRRLAPTLGLALTCTLATACGGSLVSTDQEMQIGQSVDQQVVQEYNVLVPDDPVALWANQLVSHLAQSSTQFRNPAEFGGYKVRVLIDNQNVNAMAAPGGYLYITSGLIMAADSCSEIAGVVGHELAHITERHSAQSIERSLAAEQIAQLLLPEGLARNAGQVFWNLIVSNRFSRDAEREADSIALRIAHDAGYNPYGLSSFFRKLIAMQGGGGRVPTFLSSHPASEERIAAVDAEIQQRYGNVQPAAASNECIGTSMSLAQVQQRLRAGNLRVVAAPPELIRQLQQLTRDRAHTARGHLAPAAAAHAH